NPPFGSFPLFVEMQMICSCCKKILRRGQTAFQKKGFIDVFCSKNCLFQMFPTNKTLPKTCHQCQKVILQPLDLIMAAVDIKGTMKDFCSVACLASFKSNAASRQSPQPVCSICKNNRCTMVSNSLRPSTLPGTLSTILV
uniref:MYM-type domain-containing protein n=1 Tax=Takifugu rubripes TaxID=31033 RepID=A0A3B5KBS3_TAKRU